MKCFDVGSEVVCSEDAMLVYIAPSTNRTIHSIEHHTLNLLSGVEELLLLFVPPRNTTRSASALPKCASWTLSTNDRFVGSCDLKRGLLKLGIGVSNKVADTLLQEVGGGIHFTADDLALFTGHIGDFKVHAPSSARRTKASAGKRSATVGPFSSPGDCSIDEEKDEAVVHPYHNEGGGGALELDSSTSKQDLRQRVTTRSVGLGRTDDGVSSLVLGTRARAQDHPTKYFWDELPCWAREASKSALRELMSHHQR